MKTFRMIGMTLLVMMLCVACSNTDADEPQLEVDNQKTYEVNLNFGGDYVDVTETPLSRADEPKKYYAINVYCMKTDGTQTSYSTYASGVFDNKEDMKITLLGGYKYKFECTSAIEGENKFYFYSDGDLHWPYYIRTDASYMNKFQMESSFGDNLQYGTTCYNYSSYYDYYYYDYPKMDRYYGQLMDYLPTEGGTATIPMKRCVFGVKMTVNGVPDGTLSWSQYYLSPNKTSHTGSEKLEFSSVYTFYDVYECWRKAVAGEDYTNTFTIYFTWDRANGYSQSFSKDFTVKRNVMTNINVTLSGGSEEVTIGMEEENSAMTDETTDVEYDGGSLNDTEVDPTE
jgi:hypothetical protein